MVDAVGLRRAGGTTPVTPEDYFHIGSDFKSMTAGWAAQEVDAGRIKWTTTIADAFPALAKDIRPEYREVTLLDLLSHQSGLPADAPAGACPPQRARSECGVTGGSPRAERLRVVAWAIRQPSVAKRGTFAYSNVGYVVAGAMVEQLGNEDFESSVVRRLFAPLRMKTVGFGAAGTPGIEDQPWGHRREQDGTALPISPGPYADLPAIYNVSGDVHMSLSDWGVWIRTVLRAETGLPSPWKSETARLLTTAAVKVDSANGYALGWGVATLTRNGETQRVLGHQGSNGLNSADVIVFPEAGFGILVVSNEGGKVAADAVNKTKLRLIDLVQTGK